MLRRCFHFVFQSSTSSFLPETEKKLFVSEIRMILQFRKMSFFPLCFQILIVETLACGFLCKLPS